MGDQGEGQPRGLQVMRKEPHSLRNGDASNPQISSEVRLWIPTLSSAEREQVLEGDRNKVTQEFVRYHQLPSMRGDIADVVRLAAASQIMASGIVDRVKQGVPKFPEQVDVLHFIEIGMGCLQLKWKGVRRN
jgi:hypothetical protein